MPFLLNTHTAKAFPKMGALGQNALALDTASVGRTVAACLEERQNVFEQLDSLSPLAD